MQSSRSRISQETIAIVTTSVTVGAALAGLMLVTTGNIRDEARADRARIDAAMQADRAAWQAAFEAERQRTDTALRAMHDAANADRRRFEAEILRLAERQVRLEIAGAGETP